MTEPAVQLTAPQARKISAVRADHPGAFVRPARLVAGERARAEGRVSADGLAALQDLAVLESLDDQRHAGVDVFSDGEFRRERTGPDGAPTAGGPAAEAAFLREHAPGMYKVAVPSPSTLALGDMLRHESRLAAPERTLLARSREIGAELAALARSGAPYIQLNADRYCLFVDPFARATWRAWGIDPRHLLARAVEADAAAVARSRGDRPVVAVRLCRTVLTGGRLSRPGLRPLAAVVLDSLPYDRLLAAIDPDSSAALDCLRAVPPGRSVALGLVGASGHPVPAYGQLMRVIDAAARIRPGDDLAVSTVTRTACGDERAPRSREVERRAVHLVVRLARANWPTTAVRP